MLAFCSLSPKKFDVSTLTMLIMVAVCVCFSTLCGRTEPQGELQKKST